MSSLPTEKVSPPASSTAVSDEQMVSSTSRRVGGGGGGNDEMEKLENKILDVMQKVGQLEAQLKVMEQLRKNKIRRVNNQFSNNDQNLVEAELDKINNDPQEAIAQSEKNVLTKRLVYLQEKLRAFELGSGSKSIHGNQDMAPTQQPNKSSQCLQPALPAEGGPSSNFYGQSKDLNILLLGSTGVGKSTWINGFANYLSYDTLEEAEHGEMVHLVPASFTMMNENFEEIDIKIGKDDNENFTSGQSATQIPTTYKFTTNSGAVIRIIDTPGIGDTRGIEQDKKNFEHIVHHLAHINKIHGICILLKPNEARISVVFEFCIKELLAHLHRDAVNNIVFCFTNARSTFYRPGDSFKSLKALLESSQTSNAPKIPLTRENIYCMDNEAFRFLAAFNNSITFEESERANYASSWIKAVEETTRLINHFEQLKPHVTRSTVSLNHTRQTILKLARPLATISQNIQTNIAVLKDREDELKNKDLRESELMKKLHVPGVDLIEVPIKYPKTVCAATKCTENVEIFRASDNSKISRTHFKQICHDHCYLSGVNTNQVNCAELQRCACMGPGHVCKHCGCSWNKHMHITYDITQKHVQVVDKTVEQHLKLNESEKDKIQRIITECKQRKEQMEEEQKVITKAGAKFAVFLKNNAITPYNDSLARYMEYLIKVEEDKVTQGGNSLTLAGLRTSYAQYVNEIDMLKGVMKSGESEGPNVTLDDINKALQSLYRLPINGRTIKALLQTADSSQKFYYNEKSYKPTRSSAKKKGLAIAQRIARFMGY